MRDAIGSTFMFRILIIFIALFILFMCFTVAYAKTFRLKNSAIDIIEHAQYQGEKDSDVLNQLSDYMASNAYRFGEVENVKSHCTSKSGNTNILSETNGVCIIPKGTNKNDRYYEVYTYIVFRFPIFNLTVIIPVGGETESIPVIG